ncbi:AraC family transcriptional regulator [Lysinimonas soli]|uniref:AraC family transcriptional regulator n=1 Tax=Lysinimonas soli TaxID=1074233 RepID=A0ABW0NQE6_9MICO
MTSAARTSFHLILARTEGRLTAGLRGPETRATVAPVPAETEYLGVRFCVGAVLRPHPPATMVDGYTPLPVTDRGAIILGGEEFEPPTFENVEHFVRRLRVLGLLAPSRIDREWCSKPGSERTRQRHSRALIGMSRTAVAQIDRANAAATMVRAGQDWARVVDSLGYYDQAHLAHALRRFVGHSVRELQADGAPSVSFLYKTGSGIGS